MSNKGLMEEIDEERNKKAPFAFWGMLVSVFSIIFGEFVFRVDGFLLNHSEPYMQKLPENFIGIFLIVAAVIKLIGVCTEWKCFKRWGIWSLGGIWTGLFVVTITFSFGSGYPNDSYILPALMMVACYRIAIKGDFY